MRHAPNRPRHGKPSVGRFGKLTEAKSSLFDLKNRGETKAGESKVGCGCTHLAVTAAGNAVCGALFSGFANDAFGWVAIVIFLKRWVPKRQKTLFDLVLWVAVLPTRCSIKIISSLTLYR